MRIAAGSDHAGFDLKEHLKRLLEAEGHSVEDVGAFSKESSDYPDFARRVAERVASGAAERGLLVCGTGIGMAMAANRTRGVRAAPVVDLFSTRLARAHNDANVLALGARIVAFPLAEELLGVFLATPFDGGRHERRVAKIDLP